MTPEEVVASARRCVGARFRAQGRDPETGLDCVGVAAVAMDKTMPPARYPQRGQDWRSIALVAEAMELWPIFPGEARAGDLLMVEPGPGQNHMIVMTPTGFVHADVRLRKVVETLGPPQWPVLAAWRGCQEGD
jgi:cell wall-associated NlpC family hydrolase